MAKTKSDEYHGIECEYVCVECNYGGLRLTSITTICKLTTRDNIHICRFCLISSWGQLVQARLRMRIFAFCFFSIFYCDKLLQITDNMIICAYVGYEYVKGGLVKLKHCLTHRYVGFSV